MRRHRKLSLRILVILRIRVKIGLLRGLHPEMPFQDPQRAEQRALGDITAEMGSAAPGFPARPARQRQLAAQHEPGAGAAWAALPAEGVDGIEDAAFGAFGAVRHGGAAALAAHEVGGLQRIQVCELEQAVELVARMRLGRRDGAAAFEAAEESLGQPRHTDGAVRIGDLLGGLADPAVLAAVGRGCEVRHHTP
jgi:hypothetical protein